MKKDRSCDPPKYLIFFKARDADALTSAFTEYSAKKLKQKDKPSVIAQLNRFKARIKHAVVDREHRREPER